MLWLASRPTGTASTPPLCATPAPPQVYQTILRSLKDARYLVDKALIKTLTHRKPVLLEVCRCAPPRPATGCLERAPQLLVHHVSAYAHGTTEHTYTHTHTRAHAPQPHRDVALLPHPSFGRRGEKLEPFARPVRACNEDSLVAATNAISAWLATKQRPLIVVGRRARCKARRVRGRGRGGRGGRLLGMGAGAGAGAGAAPRLATHQFSAVHASFLVAFLH